MPTGLSRDFSDKADMALKAGFFGVMAGSVALIYACSAIIPVSEKEAICRQTGPDSFEIVDIQDPAKPIVLWEAAGDFEHSNGVVNRNLITAFVDVSSFRGDFMYRVAEMDLEKGLCGISNHARSVEPHFMKNYYKLERQP